MKKLTSFITALAVSLALSISAGAEAQLINAPTENGSLAFLHDIDDSLTAEEEEKLIFTVSKAAEKIEMNVGVLITNKIDSTDFTEIIEYSENYFAETCGEGADGIMLMINNSTYLNWIATSGKGTDVYLPYSAEIMTNISESFTAGDFYSSVEIFCDDIGHVSGFKYFKEYKSITEMSEILNGKTLGRTSNEERILAYNIGISIQDVYFASKIYDISSNFYTNNLNKFWV